MLSQQHVLCHCWSLLHTSPSCLLPTCKNLQNCELGVPHTALVHSRDDKQTVQVSNATVQNVALVLLLLALATYPVWWSFACLRSNTVYQACTGPFYTPAGEKHSAVNKPTGRSHESNAKLCQDLWHCREQLVGICTSNFQKQRRCHVYAAARACCNACVTSQQAQSAAHT